jgi:integrase/recombinase XerD
MARRRGIWRRGQNGHWYTKRCGKQLLVADKALAYDAAWAIYCANYTAVPPDKITVKLVLHRYLGWCKKNRANGTYIWYQGFLISFAETISHNLTIARLKKYQVQEWLDNHDEWGDTTKNAAVWALKGALNWAFDQELITSNPIARFKAPSRTGRELWLNDEQFDELLTHVDDSFAEYLAFAFETGARPQEIRILAAKHFDGTKFTLARKDSKGKKCPRVIYLNKEMQELVERLIRLNPDGPIFTNRDDRPWTPNAVRCRFLRRLKKNGKKYHAGLSVKMKMPGLCAYTMRHSFCTNALLRGVDVLTVAKLMGHKDATMVMRVYQHLAQNHAYLLEAAQKATNGKQH